jgi:8-oxo-dGTP pyrophosphatase MutT (NUDIX family)
MKDEQWRLADVAGKWPVTTSNVLAEGNIVTVRRDTVVMPDGDCADREVIEHPGAVAVLALDSGGQVLLVRQYRHPAGQVLWEIPAGLRDVPGEPLEKTAQRELLEETGYLAANWQVLADVFPSPGISSERLRVFLARELTQVPEAERDYVPEHEEAYLVTRWVPIESVITAFLSGELHNGVAAIGVLAAYVAWRGEGTGVPGFTELRGTDAPER